MIVRAVTLAGGLLGAAGLSQFPEFSQQYVQRLGGAVDELQRQVERYEGDAARVGLPLGDYITQLGTEGPLAQTQSKNMAMDLARYQSLSGALSAMQGAGPFTRAKLAMTHMGDRDVAQQALKAFKPAMPITFEGATFAGTGFLSGWLGLKAILALLAGLWRAILGIFGRKKSAA
ncbi:MAG: DUF2937 family protein [Pelagimonas sp.]|jgi:hypothetical protein|nr:DUF2937 family protein [Pelagimonas sp.]